MGLSSIVMASWSITDVLNSWDDVGVFDYVLPFLLIFAVVFAILEKAKFLGENKGANAIIALAFGLMALQFGFVKDFFGTIFPYAGVGISIVLVALILFGVFSQGDEKTHKWVFIILGGLVALIVIIAALNDSGIGLGDGLGDSTPAIVSGLILIGLIALIVWGKK